MILHRLCNYFAPCVQLDEIIHRERMDMSFVLRRQGPVECAVSFRIRGSSMRQTQKEHRQRPDTEADQTRSRLPLGMSRATTPHRCGPDLSGRATAKGPRPSEMPRSPRRLAEPVRADASIVGAHRGHATAHPPATPWRLRISCSRQSANDQWTLRQRATPRAASSLAFRHPHRAAATKAGHACRAKTCGP